jgi:hypothetical protein
MKDIQTAVTQWLQLKTGARSVSGHAKAAAYPVLTVEVQETGSMLLCGGRQCERTYGVTVHAASDRMREGKNDLLDKVSAALIGGVPVETEDGETRILHPLDIKTEGDALTFSLTFCTLTPARTNMEGAAGLMKTLKIHI